MDDVPISMSMMPWWISYIARFEDWRACLIIWLVIWTCFHSTVPCPPQTMDMFGDVVWGCSGMCRCCALSQNITDLGWIEQLQEPLFLFGGWVNTMVFRRCLYHPFCLYIALYPHSIQSPKMIKQNPQIVNFSPWLLAYAHISLYPSCPLIIHRVIIMFPSYSKIAPKIKHPHSMGPN